MATMPSSWTKPDAKLCHPSHASCRSRCNPVRKRNVLAITLVVTAVCWTAFTWPLPAHVHRGVPVSARAPGPRVGTMIPGDHLQLMYHFWLLSDMIEGSTPFFYNLYEFNTGDDSERFWPYHYFVPFSLLYTLMAKVGGRAWGWNLTSFVTLWFTYFFTWLLVRRFVADNRIAALLGLMGLVFPYRLDALLGGSPMGFAMLWIPATLLGLDLAVREGAIAGGVLAGCGILLSRFGDTHVFFFTVLTIPFWCILAALRFPPANLRVARTYLRRGLALLPVVLLTLLALGYTYFWQEQTAGARMASGRSMAEVALFSPKPRALWAWHDVGLINDVYMGYTPLLLFLVGGVLFLYQQAKKGICAWRPALVFAALAVAIVAGIALALGTNGPADGLLLKLGRRLIPPYALVRQPAKIFCLLPFFLSVAGVFCLRGFLGLHTHPSWQWGCLLTLAAALMLEYGSWTRTQVCVLEMDQKAYQAVTEAARDAGKAPRALAVPLWPGDSAWSSLYQHYASLYRIRMANGYAPVATKAYLERFFLPFQSVNQGHMNNAQLDELRQRGIHHLLFHEDAVPPKVSPFPAGITLKRFLSHPRLRLLRRDESIWAFSILQEGEAPRARSTEPWPYFFPTRRYELEHGRHSHVSVEHSDQAIAGAYLVLAHSNATVRTRTTGATPAPDLRWLLRCRGEGRLEAATGGTAQGAQPETLVVQSHDWVWLEIPAPRLDDYARLNLRLQHAAGSVDVDTALLAAGPWSAPQPGATLELPAPCFLRLGGYTRIEPDTVIFRKDHERIQSMFFGPNLPLEPATYDVTFQFASDAPAGTELGFVHLGTVDRREAGFPVVAGQPARGPFALRENHPVRVTFVFHGNATLAIRAVSLTRRP